MRKHKGLESIESSKEPQQFNNRHKSFKPGEDSEVKDEPKRPGSGGIPEARVLSDAGREPDKGDHTRAGRAFQKHGDRHPERWGQPKGNAEVHNSEGQARLDSFIKSQDTQWKIELSRRFGLVVEGYLPNGQGARWSADGRKFIGFLEP